MSQILLSFLLLLQVDTDDVPFMNDLFNIVGDFDDKLKKFDAKRDMKAREPLEEGQSPP